jgi:hypothetical protein
MRTSNYRLIDRSIDRIYRTPPTQLLAASPDTARVVELSPTTGVTKESLALYKDDAFPPRIVDSIFDLLVRPPVALLSCVFLIGGGELGVKVHMRGRREFSNAPNGILKAQQSVRHPPQLSLSTHAHIRIIPGAVAGQAAQVVVPPLYILRRRGAGEPAQVRGRALG